MNFKALNGYELLIGGTIGLFFLPLFGAFTLWIVPIMAIFYALGGAPGTDGGNKLYRRLGCALLPSAGLFGQIRHFEWPLLITPVLAFAVYSIGYGIPSKQPADEGSVLGRFFYRFIQNISPYSPDVVHEDYATVATMSSIFLLLALAYLPLFLVR